MKCRKCTETAVINMRQHKLALCKDHFLEWVLVQTERNIQKYKMFTRKDRILVAVSGGKDSLALWDVLYKLDYQISGLYIHLGISDENQYSDQSLRFVSNFAEKRNLKLHILKTQEELGKTVPEISKISRRNKTKPCAICGLIKRHSMNEIANQFQYDVLVTGHNLDDEVSVLFNNTLSWQIDFLRRQSPIIPSKDRLPKKAKPFCRFYERETAAYSILSEIEYIEDECPYAEGSTMIDNKNVLNQLEHEHAGTKLSFYLKFLSAKQTLFPDIVSDYSPTEHLNTCLTCGQPSPNKDICSYCRLIEETCKKE